MNNPFVYGEIAVGKAFVGRKEELSDIARGLESGERIFLISPRRFGKTSLIVNLLERLKSKGLLSRLSSGKYCRWSRAIWGKSYTPKKL